MSVGPLPPAGNFAGSPLAQGAGSESASRKEGSDQTRGNQLDARAAEAAGIGKTEEDSEAEDRDADGRLAWERRRESGQGEEQSSDDETPEVRSADPEGVRGNRLDLSI